MHIKDMVNECSGVERTIELAQEYTKAAREVLRFLPDSEAKVALDVLAEQVGNRTWY
jgi:hexaprenyl-diphosphate synthase